MSKIPTEKGVLIGGGVVLSAIVGAFILFVAGCGGGEPILVTSPTKTVAAVASDDKPTGTPISKPTDAVPEGMVLVPAGPFEMGSENGKDDEKPVHTVTLDAFYIDRYEVTVSQFRAFVEDKNYKTAAETEGKGGGFIGTEFNEIEGADWQHPNGPDSAAKSNHPVVQVSWEDAQAYCQWRGARLPTEAEWEKAARGTDSLNYPWGDKFDGSRLNFCDKNCQLGWAAENDDDGYAGTAPVGSYPEGKSPYDVYDMAGNVWEWVADGYEADYYSQSPAENPTGPTLHSDRLLRRGGWTSDDNSVRAAFRYAFSLPALTNDLIGFRCARSLSSS